METKSYRLYGRGPHTQSTLVKPKNIKPFYSDIIKKRRKKTK